MVKTGRRTQPELPRGNSVPRISRGWLALGASGWAVAVVVWVIGWQTGVFRLSGDVAEIFLPAGRAFWSAGNPYDTSITLPSQPFLYAPPWAALFGLLAPLGPAAVHAILSVLEMLALRYIAGSWLRVGALCWVILIPWEIAAGQMNILVAASIVAAVRGHPRAAAVMSMAKGAPLLAVNPRDWRPFVLALLAFSVLSLPRLDLWPAWIEQLVAALTYPPGPVVPVPLFVRLPIGLALVLWGRPWSRALGAAIALPGLYWGALVVLVAPLGVIGRGRPSTLTAPD